MSLIKLKSKTEPKYFAKPTEPKQRDHLSEVTDNKAKPINSEVLFKLEMELLLQEVLRQIMKLLYKVL